MVVVCRHALHQAGRRLLGGPPARAAAQTYVALHRPAALRGRGRAGQTASRPWWRTTGNGWHVLAASPPKAPVPLALVIQAPMSLALVIKGTKALGAVVMPGSLRAARRFRSLRTRTRTTTDDRRRFASIRLDWIGADWFRLDWVGLGWVGSYWIRSDSTGLDLIGLGWVALAWFCDYVGPDWMGWE